MAVIDSDAFRRALATLPAILQRVVGMIAADAETSEGIAAMLSRAADFPTETAALLAGVFCDPAARSVFDSDLDERTAVEGSAGISNRLLPDEVIIGGGIHAAIYSAVRVASGFAPPLVLEGSDRCGGIMAAASRGPSFYLNSRNRPGGLGLPGSSDALNVLPGSQVQPSDLGGEEYQTNDALAFAARVTLAGNAKVLSGVRVERVTETSSGVAVETSNGSAVFRRAIIAVGLNRTDPTLTRSNDPRVLSFLGFMARMDGPFPLQGLKRVAVVGAGDSGRCVIECLIGQGPRCGLSVASIDRPSRIDWYGQRSTSRALFERTERPRYRSIGSFLPSDSERESLIRPTESRAVDCAPLYDRVELNGRPYDAVIDASGFEVGLPIIDSTIGAPLANTYQVGGRAIAKGDSNVYVVGPAAGIPVDQTERDSAEALNRIGENSAALFRYAYRTAALAAALDRSNN